MKSLEPDPRVPIEDSKPAVAITSPDDNLHAPAHAPECSTADESFDSRVKLLYAIGAVAVLGVSVVVIITSILFTYIGVYKYIKGELFGGVDKFTLDHLLEPLELAFFAPLPFLLYNGACRVLADLFPQIGARSPFADVTDSTERNLAISKCLVASLIIGMFATDLLRHALTDTGLSEEAAIGSAIVILALTAFIWVVKPRHH